MNKKHIVYSTDNSSTDNSSTDKGRHCPDCSRPVSTCRCKTWAQEKKSADGIVRLQRQVKGRAGKTVVVISGLLLESPALRQLAKKLKSKCGVGGSIEDHNILIQGDKRDIIKAELESIGYNVKISGG